MPIYHDQMNRMKLSVEAKEELKALYPQKEKKENLHKHHVLKSMIAIAACAAVLVCVTVGYSVRQTHNPGHGDLTADGSSRTTDNHFRISVKGSELTSDELTTASDQGYKSGRFGYNNEEDPFSYCWDFPFSCEGKHLETITYTAEGDGGFCVTEPKGEFSILLDATPYILSGNPVPTLTNEVIDQGLSSPVGTSTREIVDFAETATVDLYMGEDKQVRILTSYTVSADKQSEEGTNIYLFGKGEVTNKDPEIWHLPSIYTDEQVKQIESASPDVLTDTEKGIRKDRDNGYAITDSEYENMSTEEKIEWMKFCADIEESHNSELVREMNEAFQGMQIHCTATFSDGTTQTLSIKPSAVLRNMKDAVPERLNGDYENDQSLTPEEVEWYKAWEERYTDFKDMFILYTIVK